VSVPPAPGRSLLSALLHPIVTGSASGGIGPVLPIFLAGVLVLVLGALVVRRRRVSS
jgi:MYXO-CTERM domain-containing protein